MKEEKKRIRKPTRKSGGRIQVRDFWRRQGIALAPRDGQNVRSAAVQLNE
jgi:hypothetical protein